MRFANDLTISEPPWFQWELRVIAHLFEPVPIRFAKTNGHWPLMLALHFVETVKMTTEWYQSYYKNHQSTRERTVTQIQEYTRLAADRGIAWAQ